MTKHPPRNGDLGIERDSLNSFHMSAEHALQRTGPPPEPDLRLEEPTGDDGREMWRIVRDSAVLDVNSPYSYLLWCRDFAGTSVVARGADGLAGFITGFVRPNSAGTLFVWQVAVDHPYRGLGLGKRMLDHLGDRMAAEGRSHLEATVTPDNIPSSRLFEAFARDRGCVLERRTLFTREQFPEGHQPEVLFRIGPL
jgi:L-2,4-diaminobutyric acid acetyltransferase